MSVNTGILFVGACGHLATTAMAGALALSKKICPPLGMVTELFPELKDQFFQMENVVFGGWDIRPCPDVFAVIKGTGIDKPEDLIFLTKEVEKIQALSFSGIVVNAGDAVSSISEKGHVHHEDSITHAITKIKLDIEKFKMDHDIEKVIVINIASTEPSLGDAVCLSNKDSIEAVIDENRVEKIRPSFIYAYSAITSGCAYINFTPSQGGMTKGLVELAGEHGVPVMGSDGKTGETLVKSALAPLFAMRNLQVMSWEGYNILGNMDGKVLQHAENGSTKIKSKEGLLPHILGYSPHARVSIDYVPSLGDRKTAWDFIHFQGFMNTKMSLQFTWQGCDSALAAPLVLDLARLGILALEKGESGIMSHLASFFKSPWDMDEHSLEKQFSLLTKYLSTY